MLVRLSGGGMVSGREAVEDVLHERRCGLVVSELHSHHGPQVRQRVPHLRHERIQSALPRLLADHGQS